MDDASQQEALEVGHRGGAEIETDNNQEGSVQFGEVDAIGRANTVDDDVGCVAENLGTNNRHHDADDGGAQHEDETESFWSHPRNKSQGGVAEVFRSFDGHCRTHHAGTNSHLMLRRFFDLFFGGLAHAASSAVICDSTISA